MEAPATVVEIGPFRLTWELVERKRLNESGFKLPNQVVYQNAWVLRRNDGSGHRRSVRCFRTPEEARAWVESQKT